MLAQADCPSPTRNTPEAIFPALRLGLEAVPVAEKSSPLRGTPDFWKNDLRPAAPPIGDL